MARYAEIADLVLGRSTAWLAAVSTGDKEDALDAASGEIDGYLLAAGYTLPLVTWGGDLTTHTVSIAVYRMVTSKGYNPSAKNDEGIRARYEDAIHWLESIVEKKVMPVITDSSSGGGPQAGGGYPGSSPRVHSATSRGWSSRGPSRTPPGGFQGD